MGCWLEYSKLFIFIFVKLWKNNQKDFARNYEKKMILGTSQLSYWPSNPAYYIEDCRICSPLSHPSKLVNRPSGYFCRILGCSTLAVLKDMLIVFFSDLISIQKFVQVNNKEGALNFGFPVIVIRISTMFIVYPIHTFGHMEKGNHWLLINQQ